MSGPDQGERCPGISPNGERGVYILSGGYNKFGWLINRPVQKGQQIKGGYPKHAEELHGGLFLATPAAVRDAALILQVTGYGKMPAPHGTIWA
ncbi:hypothetical protein N7499_000076 [Penicillium canescens]|nr:hypothetical protein N7499_000076 [Penicillium canescens]KAJ6172910.1 hypothetical protein N7485_005722 [Penicillium canescens]